MTHLQLELSRGVYKASFIFETIFEYFKKTFEIVQNGRRNKANRIIASYMRHEYPHETYDYILHIIEKGKIDELHK